jgi:hypothetical protein
MSVPNKLDLKRNQIFNENFKKHLFDMENQVYKTSISLDTLANSLKEATMANQAATAAAAAATATNETLGKDNNGDKEASSTSGHDGGDQSNEMNPKNEAHSVSDLAESVPQ